MNNYLRLPETAARYEALKAQRDANSPCPLCANDAIETFAFWKVIPNEFPYDLIAERHDMLVPLRHAKWMDLTAEERSEFEEIKATYAQQYTYLIDITARGQSVPSHYHLHLVSQKRQIEG